MTRHRTFDIGAEPGHEPITFDLAGRKLECLPELPVAASALLQTGSMPVRSLIGFVEATITDESVPAFRDALADKTMIVGQDTLTELVFWLLEQYADRPQSPPSGSSDGRPNTATTSTAV